MQHVETRLEVLITALAASALSGLAAQPAAACSVVPSPAVLDGYPDDGAGEVPTDVRPIYQIGALRSPAVLELTDPSVAVDDEAAPQETPFELVDDAGAVTTASTGRPMGR
jgi:hypothetical protein